MTNEEISACCENRLKKYWSKYDYKYGELTKYELTQFDVIMHDQSATILDSIPSNKPTWMYELVYADMIYNMIKGTIKTNHDHISLLKDYMASEYLEGQLMDHAQDDQTIFAIFIKIDKENELKLKMISILKAYINYKTLRLGKKIPLSVKNLSINTDVSLSGYSYIYMNWLLAYSAYDPDSSGKPVSLVNHVVGALKIIVLNKLNKKQTEGFLEVDQLMVKYEEYTKLLMDEVENSQFIGEQEMYLENLYNTMIVKIQDAE